MWPGFRVATLSMVMGLCATESLRADRVELFTGEVFEGQILRQDRYEVSMRLQKGGALSFRRSQVRRIRRSGEPPPVVEEEVQGERQDGEKQPGEDPATKSAAGAMVPVAAPRNPQPASAGARSKQARENTFPRKPVEILSEIAIVDEMNGFSVTLPQGFMPWVEGRPPPALHTYRDPVTEASLTITAYASTEPLLEVKKSAAQAYAGHREKYKLTRDEPLGGLPEPAWLLEVTSSLGGVEVNQIQVFTGREGKVVVLTYTTTAQFYSRYHDAFAASVQSFRFLKVEKKGEE